MRSNSARLACAAVACTLLLSPAIADPWRITAGAGVAARPQFPGSDSTEVIALPALDVAYGERWFLNQDGLGAHLFRDDAWTLSLSVAASLLHRDESDSGRLRGLGDVDRTAVAQLKSRHRFGGIHAALAIATDLADEGHGTFADLTAHGRAQITPRFTLDYGVGGRWIDDEHARTFFGSPTYVADAGISELRVFAHGIYAISPQWIVSAGTSLARLQGDAADSPIVEDESFVMFDAALLYRFGAR
jgi:outer membrane protein